MDEDFKDLTNEPDDIQYLNLLAQYQALKKENFYLKKRNSFLCDALRENKRLIYQYGELQGYYLSVIFTDIEEENDRSER